LITIFDSLMLDFYMTSEREGYSRITLCLVSDVADTACYVTVVSPW